MEQMLLNIFGARGIPLRKFWRMMYWMPKFRNLSPWYLPEQLPNDTTELAKLAIQRITSVDPDTKIEIWQVKILFYESITVLLCFSSFSSNLNFWLLKYSDFGGIVAGLIPSICVDVHSALHSKLHFETST